jgi:hypothetical protein
MKLADSGIKQATEGSQKSVQILVNEKQNILDQKIKTEEKRGVAIKAY